MNTLLISALIGVAVLFVFLVVVVPIMDRISLRNKLEKLKKQSNKLEKK